MQGRHTHHLLVRHRQDLVIVVFLSETEVHSHAHRHAHVHRVGTEAHAVALQLALLARELSEAAEVSARVEAAGDLLVLRDSSPPLARRVHALPSALGTTRARGAVTGAFLDIST